MTKVIVAKEAIPSQQKLGYFAEHSDYDLLIEEDCDFYTPPNCDLATTSQCQPQTDCSTCAKGRDESRVAFIFRKGYFTKEQQDEAYAGLREAAQKTNNRGTAAGIVREGKQGNREWVTAFDQAVIQFFQKPYTSITGEHPLEPVFKRKADMQEPGSWYTVWFTGKEIDTEAWAREMMQLPQEEQIRQAKALEEERISKTTYANEVWSGIAGAFGRTPRTPYGRLSAYDEAHPDQVARALPFLNALDKAFSELLPQRHRAQKEFVHSLDPHFRVADTVFTTLTINKTFRTAYHYDAGDYGPGFSNLTVISNDGNYTGGYLVLPEFRVAVNVRPGDLLLIANHTAIHGNTPIELGSPESERISIVAYAREDLKELGTWEYECKRREYVEWCKNNQEHPFWRPKFSGVWPGQWESREYFDWMISEIGPDALRQNDPRIWEKFGQEHQSLDEFFA